MPLASPSARRTSIKPRTAYLDGAYAPKPNTPTSPAADETPTIPPRPRSTIPPSTAPPPLDHSAEHRAHRVERAEVVEVHLGPEVLELELVEVARVRRAGRADEQVARALGRGDLGNRLVDGCGSRDVGGRGHRAGADRLHCVVQPGLVACDQRDASPAA